MIDYMAGIETREVETLRRIEWPKDKAIACIIPKFHMVNIMFCANINGRPCVAIRYLERDFDWKIYAQSKEVQQSVNDELNSTEKRERRRSNYRMGPKSDQWGYGKNC